MSKDHGKKKGQHISDATVKGSAIPAKPAALSDKDLEKVAGGASIAGSGTNTIPSAFRAPNTFIKPNK